MSVQAKDLHDILNARLFDFEQTGRNAYILSRSYVTNARDRLNRISILDNIRDGKWDTVFPDNVARQGRAMIADSISTDLEDVALLAGGIDPTVICDPSPPKRQNASRDEAITKAVLRQQILANHRQRSRLSRKRPRLAADLAGTGIACMVVWPDLIFEGGTYRKDETPRFPMYKRKDPRVIFPDPDHEDGEDLLNLIVARKVKARELAQKFPWVKSSVWTKQELSRMAMESDNAEVELIEWHDGEVALLGAGLDKSTAGKKDVRYTPLAVLEHGLGTPLAVVGLRPSFDGHIRGQFDTAVAPLGAANEMYTLMIESFDRYVHSKELWIGEFENPQDDGPGARIMAREGSAIHRVSPDAVNPQVFAMVAQSLDMARISSGIPAARQGDISQSIASAQFVDRIQGKLTTQIADYQDVISDMEQRANRLALMVDEKLLGGIEKPISGMAAGKAFQRTYVPERDINGNYDNRVEFGAGAGLDHFNREVAIIQQTTTGLISKSKARQEILKDEDVQEIERDLYRERVDESILAGLLEPTTPINVRLRARQLLDEGKGWGEIAEELLATPELQGGEAPTPIDAAAEQLALVKGGIPGRAETGPEPAFPPLDELGVRRPA